MKLKKTIFLLLMLLGLILLNDSLDVQAISGTAVEEGKNFPYLIDVENPKTIEEIMSEINLEAIDDYDGDLTSQITYDDVDDYTRIIVEHQIGDRVLDYYLVQFFVSDSSGNESTFMLTLNVQDVNAPYLFDTSKTYYELDIDNINITDEDILNGLNPFDEFCGDTIKKEIVNGSIDSLEKIIDKEQAIDVKLTDMYDNETIVTVIVVLKDFTAPEIKADSYIINTSYYANASLEDLLESVNIEVLDNSDQNLNFKLVFENYSENKNIVGEYTVTLEAEDSSGNKSGCEIIIKVIDDIPPVFYIDTSKIYVSLETKLVKDDFISLLNAEKKIKNEEYEFQLIEDTYSSNYDKEGIHKYSFKLLYDDHYQEQYDFEVTVLANKLPKVSFFQTFLTTNKKIGILIFDILRWPILKIKELI